MISINNLSMGFTQRTLFKDVTFSIFPEEKIGLTGPNGSGKTTLFEIIRGEREPLSGSVTVQKGINIGYLAQEAKFRSDQTVMDELTAGDDRIKRLKVEKRRLEDSGKADTDRYGDVLEELEQLGIYELEHKAEKILMGLGFKEEDFDRPVKILSGGWQMRTLLAKLLTYHFDLLLLDEPTNYLDLPATLWLRSFLKEYKGAFVLISHDRLFLNDVTNYTIVLEGASMMKVKGNYSNFEMQRGINTKTLEKKQKVIEKKRKQLEQFTQRFHAQPNRAASVRAKRKQIERLEDVDVPQTSTSIGAFRFDDIPSSGYVVARCEHIQKAYDGKVVYDDFNLEVIRGQKICLVGPNGAGKSTLLKILAGVIPHDGGDLRLGHNVDRGYFSQTRMDVLNPEQSVFDEVLSSAPQGTQSVKVRTLMGIFNFHGDDVFKPVKVLSGGEKSRVILAKLLINPPNFILLDEPTTHLDLDGVKALTQAFQNYSGTLVFISHDLYFIQQIADHILDIQPGVVKAYPGGLDYYLRKRDGLETSSEDHEERAPSGGAGNNNVSKSNVRREKKRQLDDPKIREMHEKHQQAKKRLKDIKREIDALEKEQDELEKESYAKSRILSKSFEKRDEEIIREYGKRLKVIPVRLREIETEIRNLKDEQKRISK